MSTPDTIYVVGVPDHERKFWKEQAKVYGLSLSQYVLCMCRNFTLSGLPLQVIPPLPVEPWYPPSKAKYRPPGDDFSPGA